MSRKVRPKPKKNKKHKVHVIERDLKEIHAECVRMLVSATKVNRVFKQPGIRDEVRDFNEFVEIGSALVTQLIQAKESLDTIFKEASLLNLSGNSPESYALGAVVGDKYKNWMAKYIDVIMPLIEAVDYQCSNENIGNSNDT